MLDKHPSQHSLILLYQRLVRTDQPKIQTGPVAQFWLPMMGFPCLGFQTWETTNLNDSDAGFLLSGQTQNIERPAS